MHVQRVTKKPTTVLYGNSDFSTLDARCNHPAVEQKANEGTTYWAPHPSLLGKKKPDGSYALEDLAAYPGKLNCFLATLINSSARNPEAGAS